MMMTIAEEMRMYIERMCNARVVPHRDPEGVSVDRYVPFRSVEAQQAAGALVALVNREEVAA